MNKIVLLLFLFVFSVLKQTAGQGQMAVYNTDSLAALLPTLSDSEDKIELLNNLAVAFRESDPDKALYYSRNSLYI